MGSSKHSLNVAEQVGEWMGIQDPNAAVGTVVNICPHPCLFTVLPTAPALVSIRKQASVTTSLLSHSQLPQSMSLDSTYRQVTS